jgi:hypothetical protein
MEKVDVDKLEREMLDALRADRKYSRENDAKFRAVNQRVQTYEEFRCAWVLKRAWPSSMIYCGGW